MPNPGSCRMPALWQQPELFLGGVIRHSLAPAENRNTELASIRFAQAYLAVTFVIDSQNPPWRANWVGTPRKLAKEQERMPGHAACGMKDEPVRSCATVTVASWSRFNSCWGMHPSKQRNAISVANRISDIQ